MTPSPVELRTRAYTIEKWAISVPIVGRRARWLRYPGRLWWLTGMPELREPRRTERVLRRFLLWRFKREYPDGASSTVVAMIGPTIADPPTIGAWVRVFRKVHGDDREACLWWLNQDPPPPYDRFLVPVMDRATNLLG